MTIQEKRRVIILEEKEPLYIQIKKQMEEKTRSLQPHDQISSEIKLAEEFGVSRGTVKKAIEELISEGLLYRIPKKGTFITSKKITRSFNQLPSYSEDIRKMGFTPGALLVEMSKSVPEQRIAEKLNLNKDELIWKITRVRTADDVPIILSTSFLPVKIFPVLTREEVLDSLYKALEEKYKNRPVWGNDFYTAINADRVLASLLEIEENKALLYSERISYSKKGRPLEFSTSYIRGDRFEIHVGVNYPQAEGKNVRYGGSTNG